MPNVSATCAGSETPEDSTTMASNLRWDARSAMALTRSARSVQHTHPFCSSTSPGSSRSSAGVADQGAVDVERRDVVDDDGDAKVSGVLHDALEQRGLTGAEESGEEGHGDRGLHGHVVAQGGGAQRVLGNLPNAVSIEPSEESAEERVVS